jgi:hypothetical protein
MQVDFLSYFKLFCLAFGFGFGWNAIVLEAGQWAGAFTRTLFDPSALAYRSMTNLWSLSSSPQMKFLMRIKYGR